uniref:Si:ch211-113d11.6 n=1 Tax=Danio rerio TaxID=7955 RepID=A0A140LG38_DANRE|nr:uncharacterized protein si:ch211-113d11.6 [Danio rerio]|eukprot:XP_017214659.1 uncharacterized protein si:ch211-113d11.6 [Danio rerio]
MRMAQIAKLFFLCVLIGWSKAFPQRDVISEDKAMKDAERLDRERRDVKIDFTPPTCRVTNMTSDCLPSCGNKPLEVTFVMSDGKGSGLAYTTIYSSGLPSYSNMTQYDGLDEAGNNATFLHYSGTCCTEDVLITVMDKAGNMGTCPFVIKRAVSPSSSNSITAVSLWSTLILMALKSILL